MNVIFTVIVFTALAALTFTSPAGVLSAMLSGGEKAAVLTAKMVVIYAVWLGVFSLLEKTGLSKGLARALKPINRFLFGELPEKANDFVSLNLSANILGMSGATTPMGIKAIKELDKYEHSDYAVNMFFVINATSVQIIPSSVLALRAGFNSANAADIILPTILATLLSTVIGVLLVKIFIPKKKNENLLEKTKFVLATNSSARGETTL